MTTAEMQSPPATLAQRIEALLPLTQCGACGHSGCNPFAAALAARQAAPGACTPGGPALARRLADLCGQAYVPTLAEFLAPVPLPLVARIHEADCIGCTKCIAPCPTDAILGTGRQLHGILEADCTGCGLCLPPCPVDCIELTPQSRPDWPAPDRPGARTIATGTPLAACTDCGQCDKSCPSQLAPHALATTVRALDTAAAVELGLARCTECRACDAICPVAIPLTAHFIHGKSLVLAQAEMATRASHAAGRQHVRRQRLTRALPTTTATLVATPSDRAQAQAGVNAALERARARRAP